jgi:hypothetical protein
MPSAPASPGNAVVSVLVMVGTLAGGLVGFRHVQAYKEKQKVPVPCTIAPPSVRLTRPR